ncbi:winged helix-turn-helix DNA-binding protein [Rhodobacter maris]|uniref:Winged helix-turn-helix DNA-binding protein n=1 Tax=Rhodobacter maris TaxID=446682 RepID=A0A285TER3_9RHOB|nr:winged helix-turn-helix DNA-binding protein [Rhodobacter maris]
MRFLILQLLHQDPEMSQRELARQVGISNGSMP